MRLSLRTKIVLLIVGTAAGLASIASLSLVFLPTAKFPIPSKTTCARPAACWPN